MRELDRPRTPVLTPRGCRPIITGSIPLALIKLELGTQLLVLTCANAAGATSAAATSDADDSAVEYDANATCGAWIGTTATTSIYASHTSLVSQERCVKISLK
jgi:hypothetical protein